MPPATTYLLDTNILVYLIRGKAVALALDAHFGLRGALNQCLISVVTVGEMNSLARQWNWGAGKLQQLQTLVAQVVQIDISHPSILAAYGELDNLSNRAGRPLSKNDVWIAATTKVTGATLLTTDGDFDHLSPAQFTRIRVDASTGNPMP